MAVEDSETTAVTPATDTMRIVRRLEAEAAVTKGSDREDDAAKDHALQRAEALSVEINGRKQYFQLQNRWSAAIMWWISLLLLFNCVLVVLVGAGALSFVSTPWLITAFVTEIFLQVIGLGYIAARFLFPGSPGQAGTK